MDRPQYGVAVHLLLASLIVALLCGAPAAAAGTTVTWSAPVLIDHQAPFSVPQDLGPLSCPSAQLCVAGDGGGIVTSTDPAGGASTWTATSFTGVPGYSGDHLQGISCASADFCAISVVGGGLLTSTDPTGGTSAWTLTDLPGTMLAIACPSAKLCVGVTSIGIESSKDPTGGTRTWKTVSFKQPLEFTSIACPSVRLCVAVSGDNSGGHLVTATKPSGSRKAWTVTRAPSPDGNLFYSDVTCPTPHLCAVGSPGYVMTSTHPARGAHRWRLAHVLVDENLVCPSTHLCLSIDSSGVTTSTHPTGGTSAWQTTQLATPPDANPEIACGSPQLCVAVDSGNDVLSSANPAAGAASWTTVNLGQGYSALSGVSCPSTSACLAVDETGNVVSSGDPTGPPSAWQVAPVNTTGLASISCPASGGLCAAISGTDVLTSTTGAWSATPISGYSLTQIACSSAQLCVAGDGNGQVFASSDPTGGAGTWTTAELAPPTDCGKYGCDNQSIFSVTCPSDTFCAATDGPTFWVSQNPTGGTSAWTDSALPSGSGQQLTCPSISLCVIVSGTTVETTTDPLDPNPQWTTTSLPPIEIATPSPGPGLPSLGPDIPLISGVSCVSSTACVAVDQQGGYAFVGDPTSGTWTATQIDYSRPNPFFGPVSLTGVSCVPSGQCVAVDGLGFAITGQVTG